MKKSIVLFLILSVVACKTYKEESKKAALIDESGNLIGEASKSDFLQKQFQGWFLQNYNDHSPDEQVVSDIKSHLKGVEIKAFMGTWCGDSKRETPAFYKVLEGADFNFKNLNLITVNRSKKTPDNLQEGYDIKRVPTFIFYKKGKEIGRFVEYPRETLEKDILAIVSGKPYKHSYEK